MIRRALTIIVPIQVILLVWIAASRFYDMAPDGIVYLRVAGYYVDWNTDLMITGYFGPLLSWVLAPFLAVGVPPLLAGRIVMAASAVALLIAVVPLLRSVGVTDRITLIVVICLASVTPYWSVSGFVVPDLLLATLLLLGIALLFDDRWVDSTTRQMSAGLLFGLAYLAKPIGLPTSVLLIGLYAGGLWLIEDRRPKLLVLAAGRTFLGIAVLALPWIAILSVEYGEPTLSTSAAINHAIVGPEQLQDTWHPVASQYDVPEPGRLTTWEDPDKADYATWSPLASIDNAVYQLKLITLNTIMLVRTWRKFDLAAVTHVVLLVFLGFAIIRGRRGGGVRFRTRVRSHPALWRLGLAGFCLICLYLPVFSRDYRYYFAAYPVVLSATLLIVPILTRRRAGWFRPALEGLVIVSTLASAVFSTFRITGQPDNRAEYELASVLRAEGVSASLAGAGSFAALYVGFLSDLPFHGTDPDPTADELARSGASWLLERQERPFIRRLEEQQDSGSELGLERIELPVGNSDSRHLLLFKIDHRPSAPDHRPPTIDHRPSTIDY